MGLVGTEGRFVAHDARGHHTQGVEDGNTHDSQGERDEAQPLRQTERKLVVGEQADDERGKDGADDEGAAIADEHLGGASEDVVEEEGQQGSDTEQGEQGEPLVADDQVDDGKTDEGLYAESR